MTEQDRFALLVDHIGRDHSWWGEIQSKDLVSLEFHEHPAIHVQETRALQQKHVMVPHPED